MKNLARLSSLRNMIAFLTIIPVGSISDDISEIGEVWFLSPLVGTLIGVVAGAIAWVLIRILPNLVVGPIVIGLVILVTGAHHLDGLLDFGDAIMVRGSPEKKIEVMHDKTLGAGGLALGLVVLITTICSVVTLAPNLVIQALVASEMCAKLSMVAASRLGKSAHEGTGAMVVNAMHKKGGNGKLLIASIISLAIAGAILSYAGLAAALSSIVCAVPMTAIANKQFKGLTGDVLGATNEISRMIFLVTLLAVSR